MPLLVRNEAVSAAYSDRDLQRAVDDFMEPQHMTEAARLRLINAGSLVHQHFCRLYGATEGRHGFSQRSRQLLYLVETSAVGGRLVTLDFELATPANECWKPTKAPAAPAARRRLGAVLWATSVPRRHHVGCADGRHRPSGADHARLLPPGNCWHRRRWPPPLSSSSSISPAIGCHCHDRQKPLCLVVVIILSGFPLCLVGVVDRMSGDPDVSGTGVVLLVAALLIAGLVYL
ncbi:hypothetical protein U1Q18_051981 [Sarracenia purpurea var. burkii]